MLGSTLFKLVQLIAFTLLLITLMSCGDSALEPIPANGTILAFGDSLTEGVGADSSQSYPSVLAELTKLRVVNSGISGETSSQGLARFPKLVQQYRPDLIILIEGGNDILRNQNLKETKKNLALMIDYAIESGADVVLVGVPEKNLFSSSAGFYKELAEQYGLVFDGKILSTLLRKPSLKADYVHLNAMGYRKMAEHLHQLLVDNGALQ